MTSDADSQATIADLQQQAETHLNQQRLQQAATLCEQIIKEEPDFAPAYQTLGKALHLAKQFQKAEKCYLKAISLDPNYTVAYTNLGSLYGQQNQFQNALACYQKALQLQPRVPRTYRNLARVWHQFGDSNRETEAWFRAYGLEPASVTAEKHIELGDKLFQQNHIEKAIASYRRAFQVNPKHEQVLENLGAALKRAGDEIATARSHFIIFTRGRTGSSTLVKLLNAHPEINCQPEPFHQDYGVPFQEQYLSGTEKEPGLELDSERSRHSQHWATSYPLPVVDKIIVAINQQQKNGIKHLPYSISFTKSWQTPMLNKNSGNKRSIQPKRPSPCRKMPKHGTCWGKHGTLLKIPKMPPMPIARRSRFNRCRSPMPTSAVCMRLRNNGRTRSRIIKKR